MRKILKLELRKAFCSRLFLFSLLVGACFVLSSAYCMYQLNYNSFDKPVALALFESGQMFELILEGKSLYTGWIGAEINSSSNMSFFFLLPLLAMLPSGFSLIGEISSGYTKHIIPKCGRKNYVLAKLISAFISGGCVAALLLISSVLLVSLFLPAVAPKVINNMYYPVLHGDILSEIAYSKPLLFILCYIGLDFLFCGLFACLPVAVAFIVKKTMYAVLVPYLLIIACSLLRNFFFYLSFVEVSPIYLLRAVPMQNASKWWMVLLWYAVLLLLAVPFSLVRGVKYEIV
jgi:hypothetical protein